MRRQVNPNIGRTSRDTRAGGAGDLRRQLSGAALGAPNSHHAFITRPPRCMAEMQFLFLGNTSSNMSERADGQGLTSPK